MHVAVAQQCAFNSYVWHNSLHQWARLASDLQGIMQGALGSAKGRLLSPDHVT